MSKDNNKERMFKLIQEYPGSSELGSTIIIKDKDIEEHFRFPLDKLSLYWKEVCPNCKQNINTCKTFNCKLKTK